MDKEIKIPKLLYDDFVSFCNINRIDNVESFIIKTLKNGLTSIKFGSAPNSSINKDNQVKELKPNIGIQIKNKDIYGE